MFLYLHRMSLYTKTRAPIHMMSPYIVLKGLFTQATVKQQSSKHVYTCIPGNEAHQYDIKISKLISFSRYQQLKLFVILHHSFWKDLTFIHFVCNVFFWGGFTLCSLAIELHVWWDDQIRRNNRNNMVFFSDGNRLQNNYC